MDKNIEVGELILKRLKEEGISLTWLAKGVGTNESNLRRMLKRSQNIKLSFIRIISKALKENFLKEPYQMLEEEIKMIISQK